MAVLPGGGDLVDWVTEFGLGRVQRFDPVAQEARSTAGGFVWADDRHDGVFDAGDAPAGGVRVDFTDASSASRNSWETAAASSGK